MIVAHLGVPCTPQTTPVMECPLFGPIMEITDVLRFLMQHDEGLFSQGISWLESDKGSS